MNKDGIQTKWLSVNSYDIFRVIFGLGLLIATLYLYVKHYYNFEGKNTLGVVFTFMLFVGLALLINGMDAWRKRDKHIQKVERFKRNVEIQESKKKLELMKKYSPEEYAALGMFRGDNK